MRYILILLTLFLTGCSSTYQLSSYYSNDPIYGVSQSGDSIRVDVIENEFQFQRKLQWDDKFRWNFSTFAQNQPLSWYYRNFNQLGGWRSPYTPFDIYWNRHLFWSNWSFNYGFTYGYGFNRGIFGLNNWGSWNYPYWGRGNYGYRWNYNTPIVIPRRNRNYVRVKGRRGSSNTQIRQPRTNTTSVDRVIRRVNEGRRIIPTPNSRNRVIERPRRRIQSPPTRTRTQIRTPQRTRSNSSSPRTQVRINSRRGSRIQ